MINLEKFEISFSNMVSLSKQAELQNLLGVKSVEHHTKYLGLPTMFEKSKKLIFNFIREHIWKKLKSWKEKLLSMEGKEVLINRWFRLYQPTL